MKFFHLSDLHIGLKLLGRDLLQDQRYILQEIVQAAGKEQPDAVVIAGDIYDRSAPSAEAVEEFDRFVTELHAAVPDAVLMMVSGNHDSAARINCFRQILLEEKVYMVGQPPRTAEDTIEKVVLTDEYGPVNFYLLPFVRPSMVKNLLLKEEDEETPEGERKLSYDAALHQLIAREKIDPTQRNVLVSHQFYIPAGSDPGTVERAQSELVTVGNIDSVNADVLDLFDYAALGHIHRPMQVGSERCRYCGTPLACSVSEAGQEKGIVVVELGAKGAVSAAVDGIGRFPKARNGQVRILPAQTPDLGSLPSDTGAAAAGAFLRVRTLPLVPLRQIRVLEGSLSEVLAGACTDYVSVRLTDPEDSSGPDRMARLREAFPYLLEVKHVWNLQGEMGTASISAPERNPLELCLDFLGETDAWEEELLGSVLQSLTAAVGEGN